ncbi:uncharacterized protein O3C94_003619 [Discoglossus pictus]
MEMETSHLANVKELALTDPDITLYVDGSRYADENGKYHTGYAVTTEKDVIRAFSLPPSMSAQEAELIALTKACEIATGVRANIYTDSRYALGVTQDFGIIWKAIGFMTAAGTPVKHDKAIRELLDALALPKEVAILKVKAHGKLNSDEARGNHLADQMAKKAEMISQEMDKKEEKEDINIYTMQSLPTDLKPLKELQKTADPEEVNKWKAKGAIPKDGLYVDNLRLCLPKNLYPATVQWAHGPAHLSKTLMNALIDKYYMAPATYTFDFCDIVECPTVPEQCDLYQSSPNKAIYICVIDEIFGKDCSTWGADAMVSASPTFVHQNLELDFGDQDDTYKTSHMLKQMTTGSKESVL